MKYSRIALDIDEDIKVKLKLRAVEQKTTVKELITTWIVQGLYEPSDPKYKLYVPKKRREVG